MSCKVLLFVASIALASSALAQGGTQAPAVTVQDLNQRLGTGSFDTEVDPSTGEVKGCTVTKSTGDADLDRGVCEIMRACVHKKGTSCMDKKTAELFARLAAERTGKEPTK